MQVNICSIINRLDYSLRLVVLLIRLWFIIFICQLCCVILQVFCSNTDINLNNKSTKQHSISDKSSCKQTLIFSLTAQAWILTSWQTEGFSYEAMEWNNGQGHQRFLKHRYHLEQGSHFQICGATDKHTCHNVISEMLMKHNKMLNNMKQKHRRWKQQSGGRTDKQHK